METLTIGQLADRVGVGVQTIRFYERRGLIEDPPRRKSGYRQYPPETIVRLRFIRRAQKLGFSLREIGELISLRVDSSTPCLEVRQRVQAKMAEIDEKLRALGDIRQALETLAAGCENDPSVSECPFLETLEKGFSLTRSGLS